MCDFSDKVILLSAISYRYLVKQVACHDSQTVIARQEVFGSKLTTTHAHKQLCGLSQRQFKNRPETGPVTPFISDFNTLVLDGYFRKFTS